MNDIIVSSEENQDFMKYQEEFDKNDKNIILKDDDWYYNDKIYTTNSHLSQLLKGGPQTLKAYLERGQEDKPQFIFGRAAHCLLLEREMFNSRFYAVDDTDLCIEASGKNWKEENKSPRSTKIYKEKMSEILFENKHRQILSIEDLTSITDMIDKAMGIKQIREMVESASKREVIYQKTIEGIKTKCKVDAINPSNFILDYKTTMDAATIQNFSKSARKYGYPRQGSFYKDITGVQGVWFLVQEKKYPYTICLAELSPGTYDEGRVEYMRGLQIFKKHFIDNPVSQIDNFYEVGYI